MTTHLKKLKNFLNIDVHCSESLRGTGHSRLKPSQTSGFCNHGRCLEAQMTNV